jgi:PIN domain nuclease of toxin-antitoxin system
MKSVVADTHTIIWYLSGAPELSAQAGAALDAAVESGEAVHVSAITIVEICYLVERGRIPEAALDRLIAVLSDRDAAFDVVPLDLQVAQAIRRIPRDVVPDMPDRIIAATAVALGLPLVTRDRRIVSSGIETIW